MIGDVVFGQYLPGESVLHKLDPRIKILLSIAQIALVFFANSYESMAFMAAQILIILILSKVGFKLYLKSLRVIILVATITSLVNLFCGKGEGLFTFWIINITKDSIKNSITSVTRIVCLILVSSILTFTTLPNDLTTATERLMKPLKFLRIPVSEIAMIMTIALRFIPTLFEELNKIIMAQKARGANLEAKKLNDKIRAFIPIVTLLFVSSFRRAYELSIAMECRCYRGSENRTRMRMFKIKNLDVIAVIFTIICACTLISLNLRQ
ncbi:MAG: energy-coupling factor transporter transmembrane protein EcfT [Oscillospiraceae bacterium]|nr:energy-coupling factor transporter transmembrane protein EcfT [Oscillospiraceae bacterium]